MKRWLRRGGITLAILAVFVTAFYLEENWRGAKAWAETKAKYEAQGFSFDPKALIPPPIPDEQNFAKSEIWKRILEAKGDKAPEIALLKANKETVRWQAKNISIRGWYRGEFPPTPPAELFNGTQNEIDELYRETQKAVWYNLDYPRELPRSIPIPQASPTIKLAQALNAHARIALAAGRTGDAARDIEMNFRLARYMFTDPLLIFGLVGTSIEHINLPLIWAGIERHQWSDAQLAQFQAELADADLLAVHNRAMTYEYVMFFVPTMDWIKHHRIKLDTLRTMSALTEAERPNILAVAMSAAPSGWHDLTKARAAEFYMPLATEAMSTEQHRYFPRIIEKVKASETRLFRYSPFSLLISLSIVAITDTSLKFAETQGRIDQCRIACGLERYRLAHQKYPAALSELVPKYLDSLPHDLITGEPLKYRVEADGNYTLYSVGFNGVDDGGKVVLKKGSDTAVDPKEGDWVWPRSKRNAK